MPIIVMDEFEYLKEEEVPVEVYRAKSRGEAIEGILSILEKDNYVLAIYPGAWEDYPRVRDLSMRRGLNIFQYMPMDPVELELARGVSSVRLILAKYFLLRMSMAQDTPFKVTTAKVVDRRSLLRSPLRSIREYKPAPILLNSSACESWKDCTLCIERCPFKALQGKPPTVNLDLCTGCGLCTGVCPFGLLHMPGINIKAFEAFLSSIRVESKEPYALIASCYRTMPDLVKHFSQRDSPYHEGILMLPLECPGWYTDLHVIQASAYGFRSLLYCNEDTIARCGARRQVEESLQALTGLPVYPEIITGLETLEEVLTQPWTPKILEKASLVRDKTHAYEILAAYDIQEAKFKTPIVGRPFVDQDRCLVCEACSNMCPTKALKLVQDRENVKLVFYPKQCIACHVCESACPYTALKLEYLYRKDEYEAGKVVLATDEIARCRRCGKPIGSMKHLKMLEEKLRNSGVDEWVIESLWYCQECKVLRLMERDGLR